MKKHLLSIFAVTVSALFFVSCSSDEPIAKQQKATADENVTIADNVVVITHEDGLNASDVNIVSADSATITIKSAYLEKEGIDLKAGDAVCIWRAIDQVPFIRVVDDVTDNGAQVTMTSHAGLISDVIQDGEMTFSTDAFVNPNATGSDRYVDDDNTYHPAVVILEGEDDADAEYATGDELVARGFEVARNFQIYDKTIAVNKSYSTPGKEITFAINSGYVRPQVDIDFYLNIQNLKVQDFHAYANGRLDVSLPMSVDANVEKSGQYDRTLVDKTFELDKSLFNSPKLNFIFKLGIIPVNIVVNATVDLHANYSANANLSASLPFRYNAALSIGPKYNATSGWSLYRDFQQTRSNIIKELKIDGEANLSGEAAVYASLKANVYGTAGPHIKVGPRVKAGIAVQGSFEENYFTVNTKGLFYVDAVLGAQLEVLGYTVKNWEPGPKTLYSTTLWNWTKTLHYGENKL